MHPTAGCMHPRLAPLGMCACRHVRPTFHARKGPTCGTTLHGRRFLHGQRCLSFHTSRSVSREPSGNRKKGPPQAQASQPEGSDRLKAAITRVLTLFVRPLLKSRSNSSTNADKGKQDPPRQDPEDALSPIAHSGTAECSALQNASETASQTDTVLVSYPPAPALEPEREKPVGTVVDPAMVFTQDSVSPALPNMDFEAGAATVEFRCGHVTAWTSSQRVHNAFPRAWAPEYVEGEISLSPDGEPTTQTETESDPGKPESDFDTIHSILAMRQQDEEQRQELLQALQQAAEHPPPSSAPHSRQGHLGPTSKSTTVTSEPHSANAQQLQVSATSRHKQPARPTCASTIPSTSPREVTSAGWSPNWIERMSAASDSCGRDGDTKVDVDSDLPEIPASPWRTTSRIAKYRSTQISNTSGSIVVGETADVNGAGADG